MKSSKRVFSGLVLVVAAAVLVLASCKITSGPSTAEVTQAFNAVSAAGSVTSIDQVTYTWNGSYYSGSQTFSAPSGYGSASAVATSSGNPNTSATTMTGTVTFYDWYDTATGYVINGTLEMIETTDNPLTASPLNMAMTVRATNLRLSGGSISSFACNIYEEIYFPNGINHPETATVVSISGTVTADGFDFNVTTLSAAGAKALMISGPASKKTN